MSISGHITDADTRQGIRGMCLVVDSLSTTAGTVATATSKSDGSYVATWRQSQDTSSYRFGVRATASCGADGWWLDTPYAADVTLTPTPGKSSASGVDVQTTRAGRIVGSIVDDHTGQPISGVSVSWTATGSTTPPTLAVEKVLTGADGTYVFGGLTAGTYEIAVDKTEWIGAHGETPTRSLMGYLPDYVHHVPDTSIADRQQFSVSVGQSTVVNESIYAADAVTGTVTDATTGLPVPDVHVEAFGSSIWNRDGVYTEGYTDSLGRYRIDGLGPGSYQICFEPDANTAVVSSYLSACWKDQPFVSSSDGADPLQIDGFGTVHTGIDQALLLSS
jgi:hypothetical protein